ncbi:MULTISPECIES: hypothetical protein [unclassified Microcoleus]|uniref:hypothetical protein n=1 Tax=unclassified Microcoleus TaxID=2642155 RepID=UPI002FD296CB
MPQSSYLQTIARRGTSHLPVLMPPRSPLSRIEAPQTPEVAGESIPAQLPSEPANRVVVSSEQQPSIQMKQVRSPVDSATTSPAQVPSVELPQEIQATPVFSQTSSVSPAVQNSQQQPSTQTVQPTTPVSHSIQPPDSLAQSPNRSGQSSNLTSVTTLPKPRSYLAKAATSFMLKTSPKVSKATSPETASPEVSESFVIHSKVSKVASTETASAEVSESFVILQAPQNDADPNISASERQKFDRPPQSTATARGNTVHIGTIDIHIAPPPTPPIQPVATAPKPVALSPLARGFTSSFGLRQG